MRISKEQKKWGLILGALGLLWFMTRNKANAQGVEPAESSPGIDPDQAPTQVATPVNVSTADTVTVTDSGYPGVV